LTQNNQESAEEDGGGRVPALSLDSPWAWFYYSTFAVQVAIVTAYMFREQAAVVTSNTALDTYISVLLEVSIGVPAMAAYSLLIAVTVEAIRMIAERYLAKRFRQGKREGMAQGKREGMALGITRSAPKCLICWMRTRARKWSANCGTTPTLLLRTADDSRKVSCKAIQTDG
jgi:hypothetical protein